MRMFYVSVVLLACYVAVAHGFVLSASVTPVRTSSLPDLRRPTYDFSRGDVDRMRADITRLERLVVEICGALVYSDDFSVLERTSAALGPIYRDGNFSAVRRPILTRRAIENVLAARGLTATPPLRSWQTINKTNKSTES